MPPCSLRGRRALERQHIHRAPPSPAAARSRHPAVVRTSRRRPCEAIRIISASALRFRISIDPSWTAMPTLKLPDKDNVAAAPSPGGGAGAAAPPSPHSTHPLSREEAQTSHFQASGGRRTTDAADAAADGAPDGAPDFDGGAASDGTTLLQTVDDGAGGAPAPGEHAAPTTDNALADAMRGAADSTRADAARVRDLSPTDEHDD